VKDELLFLATIIDSKCSWRSTYKCWV